MYFESLAALFHMDGHGPYVWSVYAVALVIVTNLALAPLLRQRRFMLEESRRMHRERNIS
jgi:heme exporter protein D